jgi:SsrA-binding protein
MENKKAYYNWNIGDKYIAGLVLNSSEVKSLCQNRCSWQQNAFIYLKDNKLILKGLYFSTPKGINVLTQFTEEREINLLLKGTEIEKISKKINEKGFSLIPLKIFRMKRFFKVEIGIGEGKKKHDKKESIKEKDLDRQQKADLKKY